MQITTCLRNCGGCGNSLTFNKVYTYISVMCIYLYTCIVLLVESELQIRFDKGKMWSSLGMLLPGNAGMMSRCNDMLGKLSNPCMYIFTYNETWRKSTHRLIFIHDIILSGWLAIKYTSCSPETVEDINCNTKLFTFKLPGISYTCVWWYQLFNKQTRYN